MQSTALVHDTPLRGAKKVPLGLGVVTVDQVVPSQCRANGPESFEPTATQLTAVGHDTARRCFVVSVRPLVIVHTEPFHRSTITRSLSAPPIAVQFVAL